MVTPLCSLCTGVSYLNSAMAQTLTQNQTLYGYVACNWSYGHFCDFLAYFCQNLVAMATSLRPWNQKCLLWIGRPRIPPVISNRILFISHRNAFICIYSNFCPKIGCHGNDPLSLVYGSVTDKLPMAKTVPQNETAWICRLQLKLWPLFDLLAYFSQNLVAMATSLRPLQSEMSSLDWSTTKTPCYK